MIYDVSTLVARDLSGSLNYSLFISTLMESISEVVGLVALPYEAIPALNIMVISTGLLLIAPDGFNQRK
ncbi:MAG: ABC-type Mn2+/Zn2+ transport system permease subunit [Dinoroseobacter sp.]